MQRAQTQQQQQQKKEQLLLPAGGGGTKCMFLEPVCACVCACVCSWVCVGHLTLAQLCDSFLANGAITHARLSCESSRLYAIKIFTRHRQRGQLCESSLLATHTHTCIHALTGGCKFRQNAVAYFFAHYCTRFPSLLHLHADGKRGKCSALTHFICILHTIQYIYIYILYT